MKIVARLMIRPTEMDYYYSRNSSLLFTGLFVTLLLMLSKAEGSFGICPRKDGIGMIDFDSNNEICCDGSVKSKSLYICCDNKLVDKKKGQICCGTELASERNHLCCENNLIKLNSAEVILRNDLRCCGKGYYVNGDLKTCCGGSTIPLDSRVGCCGGVIFDKNKERCIAGKKVLPFQGVCNGQIYDKTSSSCCGVKLTKTVPQVRRLKNGTLVPNPAFDCCDEEVMDPRNEKCCPEILYRFPSHSIPKDAHYECCGHGYSDTRHQTCINDTATEKGQYGEQCGSFLIDKRTQGCCDNKLPYDNETQVCCKGSNHCILPKGKECCNGYPVNDKEVCCQGFRPCKKESEDDDKCCFDLSTGKGKTYSSKRGQACREGQIEKLRVSVVRRYLCGRFTSYSPKHEICCIDKKYQKNDGYVGCCDDKGLKQHEECCEKKEKERLFGFDMPRYTLYPCVKAKCGSYSIDTATKSCCGSQFPYMTSSKRKACCSDRELYDKRYSKCTKEGRVEPLTHDNKFCRSRIFDGAIEAACLQENGIVGKVRRVKAQAFQSFTVVTIYLRNVRPIRRGNGLSVLSEFPRSLAVEIQTELKGEQLCLRYFKKKLKFMMFFDEPLKGNQVQIFKQSPFFITKYTRRRFKYIKRGISKQFCEYYQNLTS